MNYRKSYEDLQDRVKSKEIEIERVKENLKNQKIETPSWGYANSGTRFKTFAQSGAATNIHQKLADAAQVHKYTGICPSVALHIPWDMVDDWESLKKEAEELGLSIGAINPNLFQRDEYKLGALCNPNSEIRKIALDHFIDCIEIANKIGSNIISYWTADGTNYPGQDSMVKRKRRHEEELAKVYAAMPGNMRLLIEYKFFEPSFYHTDIGDWGSSYLLCEKLGDRAQVLIDLGHHPLATNIEQIVTILLDEGRLGGFHFNNRKYADDDLTVGSINPYELFLIFHELVSAAGDVKTSECAQNISYMIDQCHNLKTKIEAMIQSVINIQEAYAKALLIDRKSLDLAQKEGRIIDAENITNDAYRIDVRPLIAVVREEMGLDPDPLSAYRSSGYYEKICKERGISKSGGGFEGS